MRNCPFNGCDQTLPSHIFACRRHWHSLSPEQKRRIHAAYADFQADRIGFEEIARRQQEVLDETAIGGKA